MTSRKTLIAASAGAILLGMTGAQAMPVAAADNGAHSWAITQIGFHWLFDDDDDDHHGIRRHHDDDDHDGAGRGYGMPQQNANPPSNGLFAPGSKPRVQTN